MTEYKISYDFSIELGQIFIKEGLTGLETRLAKEGLTIEDVDQLNVSGMDLTELSANCF